MRAVRPLPACLAKRVRPGDRRSAMPAERSTLPEWMTTADAISLLDASDRESPSLIDTSKAPCALGLLLVPFLLVIAGIVGMVHGAISALTLPGW